MFNNGLLYPDGSPMPSLRTPDIDMVNNPAWFGMKPTLGQRNNNWGNLRTTDDFEGKTGSNKSYDVYNTPEKGLRALARVLDTYSSKHDINTIDQLINRYAPASDNTGGSHENYKKFLAQKLGVSPNEPIDVKGRRADIMDAIIRFENKNRPLASPQMINQAITDADGSKEPTMAKKIVRLPNGTAYEYNDEAGTGALIEQGTMSQFRGYHQDGQNAALTQPIGSAAAQSSEIEKAMADSLRAEGVPEHEIGAYIEGQRARQADGTVYNDMGTVMPSPVSPQMNIYNQSAIDAGQSMQGRPDMVYSNPALIDPEVGPRSVLGQYQQQQVSANRRDNAAGLPEPKQPDTNILGYSPNDWIYMGSQMAEASQKGGLAGMGAFGRAMREVDTGNTRNALELAKLAAKGKKGKTAAGNNAAQISSAIVTGSIDEIIPMIDDDANGIFNRIFGLGGNTTGFFGQLLSKVGGTDANNLRSQLQTIRSNVGFDKLQAMRAASPTGGALGNVSEKENEYLQSVLGNVEQSQSPEQLKRNLLRLREAYLDIVHGYGNRPSNGPNYGTSQYSGDGTMMINGVQVKKL